MTTKRKLKEEIVSAMLSGNNRTINDKLGEFKSKFEKDNEKDRILLQNIIENACAYSNLYTIDRILTEEAFEEPLKNSNSIYNGLYIAVYNGHEKVINRLLPIYESELSASKIGVYQKENSLKDLLDSAISGNQPKIFDTFLNLYIENGYVNHENIDLLLSQSIGEDKPWFAIKFIESFNVSKIDEDIIPVKFFTHKLSKENHDFMDYLISSNKLDLSDRNMELIKKNPESSISMIILNQKLKNDLTGDESKSTHRIKLKI